MRVVAAALLAGLVCLAAGPDAAGHALLVRSSPSSRATLSQPPERVSLWFNERLEAAYSTVSVWDAKDSQIDLRDVTVDPADPRQLTVSVPPLKPGAYGVRYRVLSVDGHIVEGRLSFTVRAP